jgi:hypothetical protein
MGCAEAAHQIAVLLAAGAGMPQSWDGALGYLKHAAEAGLAVAREQLALLSPVQDLAAQARSAGPPAEIWQSLRKSVDMARWLAAPPPQMAFQSPRIGTIEGFLPLSICNWLIARARPLLAPAKVYDGATGESALEGGRTNSSADFNIAETDVVLCVVRARILSVLGLAGDALEHTTVLHYAVGQQFAPHFDFLDPAHPGLARDIAARGQRVATFLIYLNEGLEGGETDFPDLGWRYRGGKGDALLFWNVDPAGAPARLTRHAGLAPQVGEKWLLSQWLRGPKS